MRVQNVTMKNVRCAETMSSDEIYPTVSVQRSQVVARDSVRYSFTMGKEFLTKSM